MRNVGKGSKQLGRSLRLGLKKMFFTDNKLLPAICISGRVGYHTKI